MNNLRKQVILEKLAALTKEAKLSGSVSRKLVSAKLYKAIRQGEDVSAAALKDAGLTQREIIRTQAHSTGRQYGRSVNTMWRYPNSPEQVAEGKVYRAARKMREAEEGVVHGRGPSVYPNFGVDGWLERAPTKKLLESSTAYKKRLKPFRKKQESELSKSIGRWGKAEGDWRAQVQHQEDLLAKAKALRDISRT